MREKQFRAVPIFFFFLFFVFNVCDALYGPSSPVLQLTKLVQGSGPNRVVLVKFYAPWCEHSQALTPIWEKAATLLKGVVTVAALDADAHKSLAQDYGIRGFPMVKVFVRGKPPVIYQGARDAKLIAEFALFQVLGKLERDVRARLHENSEMK